MPHYSENWKIGKLENWKKKAKKREKEKENGKICCLLNTKMLISDARFRIQEAHFLLPVALVIWRKLGNAWTKKMQR